MRGLTEAERTVDREALAKRVRSAVNQGIDDYRMGRISNDGFVRAVLDAIQSSPEPAESVRAEAAEALTEVVTALRFTHEYVGLDTLPAEPGWSWYDALSKYAPEYIHALRTPEPAPSAQRYEPCVTGTDGRCTRWSHDHEPAAVPESRDAIKAEALREFAKWCDDEYEGLTAEVGAHRATKYRAALRTAGRLAEQRADALTEGGESRG